MTTEPPPLDIDRILDALKRHDVEFLLVGGVAAMAYGARRPTSDLDCVTPRTEENLKRLAGALRALNARLRVHGLSDEEAASLPTRLDADTLGRMEVSTWRTDAGDLDVLSDIPSGDGAACVMSTSFVRLTVVVSTASLSKSSRCRISSRRRSGRTDQRTTTHSQSYMSSPPRGTEFTTILPVRLAEDGASSRTAPSCFRQ